MALPPPAHCSSAGRSWKSSAAICRALPTVRRAPRCCERGCRACLESSHCTFLFTCQLFGNVQITLSSKKSMHFFSWASWQCAHYCIKREFPCLWTLWSLQGDSLSSLVGPTLHAPFCILLVYVWTLSPHLLESHSTICEELMVKKLDEDRKTLVFPI